MNTIFGFAIGFFAAVVVSILYTSFQEREVPVCLPPVEETATSTPETVSSESERQKVIERNNYVPVYVDNPAPQIIERERIEIRESEETHTETVREEEDGSPTDSPERDEEEPGLIERITDIL